MLLDGGWRDIYESSKELQLLDWSKIALLPATLPGKGVTQPSR